MYKGISDFIRNNMDGLHGDFTINATDLSEVGEGCVLASIQSESTNSDSEDFILYPDGREEQVER